MHVIINPNCLLSENLLQSQPKNRKAFRVSTLKYYSYISTVVYKQQYANYTTTTLIIIIKKKTPDTVSIYFYDNNYYNLLIINYTHVLQYLKSRTTRRAE